MLEPRLSEPHLLPEIGVFFPMSARDLSNAVSIRDFVGRHDNAFGRDDSIGHITASAFIVNAHRTAVLLTHHAKLQCWLPVGGHCDGVRNPSSAALREASEETGLSTLTFISQDVFDLDIHEIAPIGTSNAHLHFDVRYLLQADDNEPLQITPESQDLRWAPLDKLHRYTDKYSVLVIRDKLHLT